MPALPRSSLTEGLPATDALFYIHVRHYVIFLILFCSSYVGSYLYLSPYRTTRFQPQTRHSVTTFLLCALTLSIACVWLALLLCTTLVSADGLRLHWLLSWLDIAFVSHFWVQTSWASSLCLFVIVPFSYLYDEAEGVRGVRGALSRLIETLMTFSLLSTLLFGSFQVAFSIWDGRLSFAPINRNTIVNMGHYLPGLLLIILSVHKGFVTIISNAVALRVPLDHERVLEDRIACYDLQLDFLSSIERGEHLSRQSDRPFSEAKAIDAKNVRSWSPERIDAEIQMIEVQQRGLIREHRKQKKWFHRPIARNVLCFLSVAFGYLFTLQIVCRVVYNEFTLVMQSFAYLLPPPMLARLEAVQLILTSAAGSSFGQLYNTGDADGTFTLVSTPVRFLLMFGLGLRVDLLPSVHLLIDILTLGFFVCASLVGVSQHRIMPSLKPDRPLMQPLLLYCAIVLLLISCIPMAVWTLGICHFPLQEFYPQANLLMGGLFSHLFNVSFIALTVWQLTSLWYATVMDQYQSMRAWVAKSPSTLARALRLALRSMRVVLQGFRALCGYLWLHTCRLSITLRVHIIPRIRFRREHKHTD